MKKNTFIKKVSCFVLVAVLAAATAVSASAEELKLSAEKDVAYTLLIPSGAQEVDITKTEAQVIGQVDITAGNFTEGTIDVTVESANTKQLKNKEVAVDYTLSDESWSLGVDAIEATAQDVTLKVTDPAQATIAGIYTDTLTFNATPNGVA